jgi:phosphatidylglycerophosphate synthase
MKKQTGKQSLYQEYRSSLKDINVEELVDLYFFRLIAFFLVKVLFMRVPITPNQISLLSMTVGIGSGVSFAFGTPRAFLYGGLLYALAHVLDCSDGMVARLKKNGALIGRIVDGWTDYITTIAVYIGLLIGLLNGPFDFPVSPWWFMIGASFSLAIHSLMADYHRHEFMAHGLGKVNSIRKDLELFSERLDKLKKEKRNYLEILLLTFYLGYTKMQVKDDEEKKKYPRDVYYNANRHLVFTWNLIGPATHIFVLIVSAVLYEPMIYFVYTLGIANLWMLVIGAIQLKTNRRIIADYASSGPAARTPY